MPLFPEPLRRLVEGAGLDIDGHHGEIRTAELRLEPVEGRHLGLAGRAPRRPQVHEPQTPVEGRQGRVGAVRTLEGEGRGRTGRLEDLQGRDGTARLRGDAGDGLGRPRAGGGSCRRSGPSRIRQAPPRRRRRERPRPRGAPRERASSLRRRRVDGAAGRISADMSNRMWGGRFASGPAEIMEEINASIGFDKRLAPQDIRGSLAHVAMLGEAGILPKADVAAIQDGLKAVARKSKAGASCSSANSRTSTCPSRAGSPRSSGPPPGRLHTARSRNDQVATDMKLWVRDTLDNLDEQAAGLQRALAEKALAHAGTVMPGFTHLQSAQPVTFGHHCLAYVEMLARDRGRFRDARARLNECPWGRRRSPAPRFPSTARHGGGPRLRPSDGQFPRFRGRPRLRPRIAVRRLHLRRPPLALCRGTRGVDLGAVRFRAPVGRLHHRLVDHAAEAQPGRRRTRAREIRSGHRRADGSPHRDEGPAARLFEGHAGGQGGHLRRPSGPVALLGRHDRYGARPRTQCPRSGAGRRLRLRHGD